MQNQRELLEDFAVAGKLSVESSETQRLGIRQGPNFCAHNVQVDNLDNVSLGSGTHGSSFGKAGLPASPGLWQEFRAEQDPTLHLADGCAQQQPGWRRTRNTPRLCVLAKLDPACSQHYSLSRDSGFPKTRVGEAWNN